MDKNRLQYLLHLWVNNQIDHQQELELMRMLSLKESVEETREFAENVFHDTKDFITLDKEDSDRIFLQSIAKEESQTIRPVHRIHFLKTAWFRYAAAVIIFLSVGAYLWNYYSSEKQITAKSPVNTNPSQDINPGSSKAILVLGDESIIDLDTALNGRLTTQGNSEIIKTAEGEIIYTPGVLSNRTIAYQKLITPKGGQYQVTLSDGTQVWLNAASSIRFPNVFTGEERTVEITGEVYFDVSKNAKQPFVVITPKEKIIVLGTQFNVNTYLDEPYTKTSLISGSVKIVKNNGSADQGQILKPGEAYANGMIARTNTEQDIAWKNGFFAFKDADIKTVIRQLSRWYDVEVKYTGEIPTEQFTGKIGRMLTLQQVLRLLGKARINFTIDNNIITILPEK